jgi:endoglucanase
MIRHVTILCIGLVLGAFFGLVLRAVEPGPKADSAGFVSIFDGKTLQGWHVSHKTGHGTGGRWVVENGAIVGSQDRPGNGGILITDARYGNFEVVLEMNNDFGPDSGLFLRSTEEGKAYQAFIDYHADASLMGVYGEGFARPFSESNFRFLDSPDRIKRVDSIFPLPVPPELWPDFWKHGEWHVLRARIVGNPPTIDTWINGVQFMHWSDKEKSLGDMGGIALQVHGGNFPAGLDLTKLFVRYRNIRVKVLDEPAAAVEPFDQVKRLGRGVNILGYDPIWDNFGNARFKAKHFKLIHDAGFQTVRINLHALQRMGVAEAYKLDESWLGTLDWAVKNALANGLMVILDLHNYNDVADNPVAFKPRVLAFWEQIGERFKDAPDSLLFEILNEPNGKLTPALWKEWLPAALAVIRKSNPNRTVVVGPPEWNGINYLGELTLPESDRNIIVTVHYYEPFPFTHQGAEWTPEFVRFSGVTWGSEAERKRVSDDFARVQQWSQAHRRPILLGEFGAYDKGPMESRARYTAFVARTAESLGWAWAYWQFDSDFIVYDIDKDRWVEPILSALMPGK